MTHNATKEPYLLGALLCDPSNPGRFKMDAIVKVDSKTGPYEVDPSRRGNRVVSVVTEGHRKTFKPGYKPHPATTTFTADLARHTHMAQTNPDVALLVSVGGEIVAMTRPWRATLRWLKRSGIKSLLRQRPGRDSFCERATKPEIEAWLRAEVA